MTTEVRVPTLGESVTEATVATWFKKPGDAIAIDDMLCELETDKVTVEVPSPAAGKLDEIVAQEGETVGVDALLAHIAEAGNAGPEETAPRKDEDKTESGSDSSKSDDDDKKEASGSDSGSDDDADSGEEVEVIQHEGPFEGDVHQSLAHCGLFRFPTPDPHLVPAVF